MSPTVFRHKNFRFFFFSREEKRKHVHVTSPNGEAKFWLEPVVTLAKHTYYSERVLKELKKIVEEHKDEIEKAWDQFFKS